MWKQGRYGLSTKTGTVKKTDRDRDTPRKVEGHTCPFRNAMKWWGRKDRGWGWKKTSWRRWVCTCVTGGGCLERLWPGLQILPRYHRWTYHRAVSFCGQVLVLGPGLNFVASSRLLPSASLNRLQCSGGREFWLGLSGHSMMGQEQTQVAAFFVERRRWKNLHGESIQGMTDRECTDFKLYSGRWSWFG